MSDQEDDLHKASHQDEHPPPPLSLQHLGSPAHNSVIPPEDEQRPQQDPQGMSISPQHHPTAHNSSLPSVTHDAPPTVRRPGKRKKPVFHKQRAAVQKKLRLLEQSLRPVPFSPPKTLDFSKHETLLRRLGLWDFARLDLDREIRSDLLTLLFANYNPTTRSSLVNDCRIKVSRADLARALKLPAKKEKSGLSDLQDLEIEPFTEDSISVIENFVSNYILLHEEDTWMMPDEVSASVRVIKEGKPQKVDFAGLIWFMVEKEISRSPTSELFCYYASYLQCLIKFQKPYLFKEERTVEVYVEDQDEEDGNDPARAKSFEDLEVEDVEHHDTALSLGFDRNENELLSGEDAVHYEECKEESNKEWFFDGKGNPNCEQYLQHCSNSNETKEDEEGHLPSENFAHLESLPSANLIREMDAPNISYDHHVELHGLSSGTLLSSREDINSNILLDQLNHGGLSMYESTHKREISDEDDLPHICSHMDHQSNMKNDGAGDHSQPSFELCVDHMQAWLGKCKSTFVDKERECERANLQIQVLSTAMQQRESYIRFLESSRDEEQSKRELYVYRYQRELGIMTELLNGYKKALWETRREFSQYREQFKQHEESIYKDVNGSGGDVLSTTDLEKLQLEKMEKEKVIRCLEEEEKIKNFEQVWFTTFSNHLMKIDLLENRLKGVVEDTKLLKDSVNRKSSDS